MLVKRTLTCCFSNTYHTYSCQLPLTVTEPDTERLATRVSSCLRVRENDYTRFSVPELFNKLI